jgi:hypothetical protein
MGRLLERDLLAEARGRIIDDMLETNIFLRRPTHELPVQTAELDRQAKIDAGYEGSRTPAKAGSTTTDDLETTSRIADWNLGALGLEPKCVL